MGDGGIDSDQGAGFDDGWDEFAADEPLAPDEVRGGTGRAQILADADRAGGLMLMVDRIRQSYVDLDDPTYLDFEYVQTLADVLDALAPAPPARFAVTHVGGGG